MLRVRPTGVGPWRHSGQAQATHQALCAFAVDTMAATLQVHHHLPAAVKRMAGVFLIDQAFEDFVPLSGRLGLALGVDGSAYDTGQRALALLSHSRVNTDPAASGHGRLIPDFFLSQSSSILSRPISPYSRSGALCGAMGWGPRLPSNKVLAWA